MSVLGAVALGAAGLTFLAGASCRSSDSPAVPQGQGNDLEAMQRARLTVAAQPIEAWLARTADETQKGLMFVEKDQMKPLEDGTERGMLFIFDRERPLYFYMRNTIIPLDIAYAKTDGTIVSTHTMTPLDLSTYPSGQPARFALEVNAGLFARLGVKVGDRIDIPDTVLNPDP